MKRRIALWALAGFAVAAAWVIYGIAAGPEANLARSVLVAITAPVALLGRHMALSYYWAILLNGAIYAMFGLAVETLRQTARSAFSG
jgi:hypothetical protein